MSKKLYEESNIQAIAAAIREKNGTQNTYTAAQMANAVRAITTQPNLEMLSVNQNGRYLPGAGKDGFSEVNVAVSGGTPNLQSKTVTPSASQQTVQPDSGYDGLSSVVVNGDADLVAGNIKKGVEIFGVTGSYEGSGDGSEYIEEWDLSQSLTGKLHNISINAYNTAISSAGVVFDSATAYLMIPISWNGITIEVDVATMNLERNQHRRFIMVSEGLGLIYRNTGVWGFYSNSGWATDSGETDGSFFDDCTVKVVVDTNGYWHIYKDGILWWEPNRPQTISGSNRQIRIGSNDQSINNAIITGIRLL